MNAVNYLLGPEEPDGRPLRPYDDHICEFMADLSRALRHDPGAKAMPDVLSLGFWCRKANLQKLKSQFGAEPRLGRGLVFHVAPSNVPVNFAFSWLFSLLAGNVNIVRVPSRPFPQIGAILAAIGSLADQYPDIVRRTSFISYPADDDTTAAFCQRADARVLWGGDATVGNIRRLACKPRCVDVTFPDRYSLAMLDGPALEQADQAGLDALARNFYNDTYLMDQNACSSPQIIFWQRASGPIKDKFWQAVEKQAKERYILQAASAVDKFDQSCRDAVSLTGLARIRRHGNVLYRALLADLPEGDLTSLRGSCGYFYEHDLADWQELVPIVTEKYQTLTYYGLDPKELGEFVLNAGLRGIDRIVPVGSAMDIGGVWDGFDLIRTLSRLVQIN